jgi:hypothetical protein
MSAADQLPRFLPYPLLPLQCRHVDYQPAYRRGSPPPLTNAQEVCYHADPDGLSRRHLPGITTVDGIFLRQDSSYVKLNPILEVTHFFELGASPEPERRDNPVVLAVPISTKERRVTDAIFLFS